MMSQSIPAGEPAAPAHPIWKFVRFPLVLLVILSGLYGLTYVWNTFDLPPEGSMPLFMAVVAGTFLSGLLLLIWWVFLTGLPWLVRIGGLLFVAAAITALILSVRTFEMTNGRIGLVPRFTFVWEPTQEQRIEEYRTAHQGAAALPTADLTVGPRDYPQYRGKTGDGHTWIGAGTGPQLALNWDEAPPKVLWRQPVGLGYSGVAVAGNAAVTLEQRGEQEAVVCYDRATGRERWAYAYDAYHKDVMGDGPRSTPTIRDGLVYSYGATGDLVCLDGTTGQRRWSTNVLTDSDAKVPQWGLACSPLLAGHLVIVEAGIDPDKPGNASLAAYDRLSGKRVWAAGKHKAGYSTPLLATLGGVPQVLIFDGAGLTGHDLATGKVLWSHPWVTFAEMNIAQPLVFPDGRVFISSELINGGAMLQVRAPKDAGGAWVVEEVWKTRKLGARFANPITDGKYIYGLHNNVLVCLDAATGKRTWQGERYGSGQMLRCGDLLLVVSDEGALALVRARGDLFEEVARFDLYREKTWNTPALAGDQLFVRNQREIACVRLPLRDVGD